MDKWFEMMTCKHGYLSSNAHLLYHLNILSRQLLRGLSSGFKKKRFFYFNSLGHVFFDDAFEEDISPNLATELRPEISQATSAINRCTCPLLPATPDNRQCHYSRQHFQSESAVPTGPKHRQRHAKNDGKRGDLC